MAYRQTLLCNCHNNTSLPFYYDCCNLYVHMSLDIINLGKYLVDILRGMEMLKPGIHVLSM